MIFFHQAGSVNHEKNQREKERISIKKKLKCWKMKVVEWDERGKNRWKNQKQRMKEVKALM